MAVSGMTPGVAVGFALGLMLMIGLNATFTSESAKSWSLRKSNRAG